MLIPIIELLGLVVFASVLQSNYKIPSPLTIMGVVLICLAFNVEMFHISNTDFDTLVLVALPVLIATDSLKIKWSEIKAQGLSLFWVAVVMVLLSIGAGVLFNDFVLVDYDIGMAAVVLLFCMVAATDPVTVSAVFSNFKVPHKLKLITEGESLFNDATALIVFSIALVALNKPEEVTASFILYKSFAVIAGALAVGGVIGFLTTQALRLSEEALVEATILILGAYAAYWLAEHFHFSGILAVIVAILMANNEIQRHISQDDVKIEEARKSSNFGLFRFSVSSHDNQVTILKSVDFASMLASALLFASIASIVNFEQMWLHRWEILAVFIASTIIRGVMMMKFAFLSNKVRQMQSIQKHWWAVLTFAGSKGALSILMVHMLPNTFQYKQLFENIIVGNIILSTFVYAILLAAIFAKNRAKFEQECLDEAH